ncbi:conserved hypothetical protein [Rippkaea orientalis PCC 8801]|uniref:Tetratricopeptide repeat protein n=1 Tax=Rippkaea orientalis (strain PCC 8801 / RF-1) TaxID=41431 RepID=B7JVC5_RIPO1|nr:tetratricopeptide repeat protein [Rippkaea orientalis]ACK68258.1 conserved hypothetical protein [Rippkaea orientalis PCC 8801]
MSSETQEEFELKYQVGQELLERGQYRLSVETLEEARELVNLSSRLGGEVQMWLVTAYQAAGRLEDAIALCEALTRHPNGEIRKQSQGVLYILRAPKLKRPEEWMVKIPTAEGEVSNKPQYISSKPINKPSDKPSLELEDLSKINTQDNYFIWVALGFLLLLLGGTFWFAQ